VKGSAVDEAQLQKIAYGAGFLAALDQSGGSTPKALKLYGIEENAYSNDAPGLQTDARLTYTFAEAGEYILSIRDVMYRGGPVAYFANH